MYRPIDSLIFGFQKELTGSRLVYTRVYRDLAFIFSSLIIIGRGKQIMEYILVFEVTTFCLIVNYASIHTLASKCIEICICRKCKIAYFGMCSICKQLKMEDNL